MASKGRHKERDASDEGRRVCLRVVSVARPHSEEGGVELGEVKARNSIRL
jgi:hypothetical protein